MSNIIDEIDKVRCATTFRVRRRPEGWVHVKVVEGSRTRVQVFSGIVIRVPVVASRESFTVRKLELRDRC